MRIVVSIGHRFQGETNSSIGRFFFSSPGTSVKVEEISDVTQEAEFWISMNDPRRAIEILEPQEELMNLIRLCHGYSCWICIAR